MRSLEEKETLGPGNPSICLLKLLGSTQKGGNCFTSESIGL